MSSDLHKKDIEDKYKLDPSRFDITQATHPFVCVLHVFFKFLGGLSYIFLGLFTRSSIVVFVTVLMCGAFDFWIVKNITGR